MYSVEPIQRSVKCLRENLNAAVFTVLKHVQILKYTLEKKIFTSLNVVFNVLLKSVRKSTKAVAPVHPHWPSETLHEAGRHLFDILNLFHK